MRQQAVWCLHILLSSGISNCMATESAAAAATTTTTTTTRALAPGAAATIAALCQRSQCVDGSTLSCAPAKTRYNTSIALVALSGNMLLLLFLLLLLLLLLRWQRTAATALRDHNRSRSLRQWRLLAIIIAHHVTLNAYRLTACPTGCGALEWPVFMQMELGGEG